jgi:WD40 repeat protein/tRNA A-37 threonylcarbamoyl transferase component Bud32
MPSMQSCPHGHQWSTETGSSACPVCGLPPLASLVTVEVFPPSSVSGPQARAGNGTPGTHPDSETSADSAPPRPAGKMVHPPGYEILGEIGRGGMGVVYKARQTRLNRVVALKMVLAGGHAGEQELARFRREAEAVAQLQHPGIVQVFEVGEQDGLPFFSLEFVGGGSLASKLRGNPWSARRSAEVVAELARAVQHAHAAGIVHRDLKPGNVLMTPTGQTKVTDFGLAKKLDAEQDLSRTGAVMGTPSYMAPEQALGQAKGVGPAADVYALGVILYEMLTGRVPFKGATTLDTLELVRRQEPVPPSRLVGKVPRDLDTVCLKCLQKDPGRRYGSAAELADDLGRFLRDEPIRARPVGRLERGWRWCRRNPVVAALGTLLVVLLLGGAIGAAVAAVQYSRLADDEFAAKNRAIELASKEARARDEAEKNRKDAERESKVAKDKSEELQRQLSQQYVANGSRAIDDGDYSLAQLWFARALELDRDDPRRSEAHRLRLANTWRQMPRLAGLFGHEGSLSWVEISPDGRRAVTAGFDCTARIWDLASGRQVGKTLEHQGYIFCARFSPDGKKVATAGGDATARVWDAETGEPIGEPMEHAWCVHVIAFSPDGKHLAAGCGDLFNYNAPPRGVDPREEKRLILRYRGGKPFAAVWDLETHTYVTLAENPGAYLSLSFSADGTRVALAYTGANTGVVCDAASGEVVAGPFFHPHVAVSSGYVMFLELSPDGSRLVTGTYDGRVHLWDVDTGAKLIDAQPGNRAFFSKDGKRVVGQGAWDAADGKLVARAPAGFGAAAAVWRGADSTLVLARTEEGYRLWDAQDFKPLTPLLRVDPSMPLASLGVFGRFVLVTGQDRVARLWDLAGQGPACATVESTLMNCQYNRDGSRFVTAAWDNSRIWDPATGDPISYQFAHGKPVRDAAFTPDGRQVLTAGEDGCVRFWDAATGKRVGPPLVHERPLSTVLIDPAGERVVAVERDGDSRSNVRAHVWDLRTRRKLWEMKQEEDRVHVGLSPDGKWLAISGGYGITRVWDMATGQPITPELKHLYWAGEAGFSPDNRLLATASGERIIRLWELPSGKLLHQIEESNQGQALTFSPDGRWLATGNKGGDVRVWEAATGKPVTPWLHLGTQRVLTVSFSPDGRWLLAGGDSATVQAWDAATGERLGPSWPALNGVMYAHWRPDGRQVAVAGWVKSGQLWDFTTPERSLEDEQLLAEVSSGSRLDATGSLTPLSPAEIVSGWQKLRERLPEETRVSAARAGVWYGGERERLLRLKRTAEATAVLERAAAECPDDPELRIIHGVAAAERKDYDTAIEDYRAAARRRARCWLDVAGAYFEAKRLDEGVKALTEAIDREPDNGHLRIARARLDGNLGRWKELIEDTTRAFELGTWELGWMYANRGWAYAELGRWAEARADYAVALEQDPDAALYQIRHVAILIALRDEAALKEAVGPKGIGLAQRGAKDPYAAGNAAWIMALTPFGDPKLELELIEHAAKEKPQDYAVMNTFGLVLYRNGRFEEAVKKIEEAIAAREKKEANPWDCMILAMACHWLNKADEADKWYGKVQEWFAKPAAQRQNYQGKALTWTDRVELEVLHDEVRRLLEKP